MIMGKFKWEILKKWKIKVKKIVKNNKGKWCKFNNKNSLLTKIKEIQEVILKRKLNEINWFIHYSMLSYRIVVQIFNLCKLYLLYFI